MDNDISVADKIECLNASLKDFFGGDIVAAQAWMNTANIPAFNGRKPIDVVMNDPHGFLAVETILHTQLQR